MVHCYICGSDINYLGWAKHVAKEKRLHGEDIFERKKIERKKNRKIKPMENKSNKRLEEFL